MLCRCSVEPGVSQDECEREMVGADAMTDHARGIKETRNGSILLATLLSAAVVVALAVAEWL